METIAIWDGPLMDLLYTIPDGLDRIYYPTRSEQSHDVHMVMWDDFSTPDISDFRSIEYIRTNKEDWKGRTYFAMKRL